MACSCSGQAQSGPAGASKFEAQPYRSDVAVRTFDDRGEAEMYLARNGGGKTRPVQEQSAPIGA